MKYKLQESQNWPEVARQANWSAGRMAKLYGVSVRTLERHFQQTQGKSPKAWLTEQRFEQATKLQCSESSVKEIASRTGYRHASTFARQLKKFHGRCPHAFVSTPKIKSSQPQDVA